MIKELEKEHEISEDESHQALDDIQKLTDKFTNQIDDLYKRKEKEILNE